MREFLLQKSATISKDTSSIPSSSESLENTTSTSNNNSSVGIFEASIDPEHYRSIQEYVEQIAQGIIFAYNIFIIFIK